MLKEISKTKMIRKNQGGYALIAALLALVLVTVIGLSAMDTAITEKGMATGARRYRQQLKVAETAAFEAIYRLDFDPTPTNLLPQYPQLPGYEWVHGTDGWLNGKPGKNADLYLCEKVCDPGVDYIGPADVPIDDFMMDPANWYHGLAAPPDKLNCAESVIEPGVALYFIVQRGKLDSDDFGEKPEGHMYAYDAYGGYYKEGIGWRVVKIGFNKRIKD